MTKYDYDLIDWGMNSIKQVKKAYYKVLKGIHYWKQELLDYILDKSLIK